MEKNGRQWVKLPCLERKKLKIKNPKPKQQNPVPMQCFGRTTQVPFSAVNYSKRRASNLYDTRRAPDQSYKGGKVANTHLLLNTEIFFSWLLQLWENISRSASPSPSAARLSRQLVFYLGVLSKPGNFTTFLLAVSFKNNKEKPQLRSNANSLRNSVSHFGF